jgi:N-acetyl-gamma-glutamyl-phosphate/LysW-gamma-L-alpha-aminoadipyl-6-phosphate reductase
MTQLQAAIVGGSGYTGGELLRLLLGHPHVEVTQVTSRSLVGKLVTSAHPNLRKRAALKFIHPDALARCDLLFLCLPHGAAAPRVAEYLEQASVVIDLSADFRLKDPAAYGTWYGWQHPRPEMLAPEASVYGLPELHRAAIARAAYIASPGCNATAAILGLWPLATSGLLDPAMPLVVEAKSGSSGAGGEAGPASHHPERSGIMRSFKPTGHRHTAEVIQELAVDGFQPRVSFTATSVEAVRGILATCHAFTKEPLTDKDLWQVYRAAYKDEPFIRLVKEASGIHRSPEPKILSGSNFCDIGFEADPHDSRVVVLSAIDNLMKGAAGQAVQAMNIRYGFEETCGLEFTGLHPL